MVRLKYKRKWKQGQVHLQPLRTRHQCHVQLVLQILLVRVKYKRNWKRVQGTNATDNTTLKKRKREKLKNKDPDSGDNLSNHESTQEGLCTTKVLELKSDETVSAKTATPDANVVSDADHSEFANGKTGEGFSTNESTHEVLRTEKFLELKSDETVSVKTATPDANMVSKENHSEVSIGKTGEGLNTKESTQEGSSTTKVLELKKDETLSAKTATPDANMVAKEQVQTEVANGRTGESEKTNNGNNPPMLTKSQKRNRRNALKKKPYPDSVGTSETVDNKTSMSSPAGTTNLNGNVEVQKKMETSPGTNATDNTTLKKIKREKMENNNPDTGDNSSTHQSTQEGLGTTKVLEVKGDKTVLAITATIDANVASKEDHSEVAIGETGESETTNLNVSGKEKRKRKPKSNDKKPILGEILDPVYLQNLEASKHNLVSNEQKRQKINDNSALGDILSTCENTSKVLQAVSADVSQGEEHMKDANVNDVGKEETELKVPDKKLIILDVNGLLADVVSDLPDDIIADKYITRRAIFKRPYVDEFLSFCFERFHVGIWSSRFMRNLVPVVNFLLGDLKKQLLFLWDGCKCTDSGVGTLDVQYKNVVVKDLRKIWDEDGPNNKWVKGTFNESNTLLVDDSPYKGLLNPKYTGIFPASYSYMHSDDNLLGLNGELQTYLEGLAAADDVKTYVEQHPFGQGVIDEQSPDWVFYSSLIERLNNKPFMERLEKENKWKRRRCC
ncbi:uncharacterized protein LOC143593430 [Bidens hawaiensis]|uniref:uncharacterized protein LOC143593430 n=1 Tax=Bidens hawaiensis TaxID=980011 RepID=UPI004049FEC6